MNTTAKALVLVAVIGTALAALGLAGSKAEPATEVVKLERVVVEGKRMQSTAEVVQLPQVVITGRRATQTELQLAAAKLAKAI